MTHLIKTVKAREILDSRGNPTIEVEIMTNDGVLGRASVPSGASTGVFEVVELRDGGKRFHGKGVLKAVKAVQHEIRDAIVGIDVRNQTQIDMILKDLDGSKNKSCLGGNSILGVSIACAKTAAKAEGQELYEYINPDAKLLPVPFFNVINGGEHAGNFLDIQEFMIAPVGAKSFREAYRMGSEIYHTLKIKLLDEYGKNAINVGDEGGFSPPMERAEEALDSILYSIEELGYDKKTKIALDVAASTFYKDGKYSIDGKLLNTCEIIDYYSELVKTYPISSIEDPLYEDDFIGFVEVTKLIPIQILGDDIFVTNPERLKKGIKMGACNALLWKVNQIGSLTESLNAARIAQKNNYNVMASHRSGETEDSYLADLSVGICCGQIKSGAPCRGERTAKYNQLLRIEEKLSGKAEYPTNLFS